METKQCVDCKRELPVDQFYRRKPEKPTHTTIYTGQCKECRIKTQRKWWKDNVSKHRKSVNARYHVFGRFARYGLSLDDYDEMLKGQDGKCALCRADKPGGKGKWHIDHVGGTNPKVFNQCKSDSVRGLLCHHCNVSLGHYEKLLHRVGRDKIVHYLKE